MHKQKHVITYPGFAESKSARGLFTDIQKVYSDKYLFHILPFYEEIGDDRKIYSVERHAEIIQEHMDNLDGEIIMLSKCGGSRPTVAMDDEHIARLEKLCLFNPPWKVSNELLLQQLKRWKGVEQPDGSWTIPREKGSYIVTSDYINNVEKINLMDRFREVACLTRLSIVRALSDELITPIQVEKIAGARAIDIEDGDHHLTGAARQKVLGALAVDGIL